jgi:hypothetical protein
MRVWGITEQCWKYCEISCRLLWREKNAFWKPFKQALCLEVKLIPRIKISINQVSIFQGWVPNNRTDNHFSFLASQWSQLCIIQTFSFSVSPGCWIFSSFLVFSKQVSCHMTAKILSWTTATHILRITTNWMFLWKQVYNSLPNFKLQSLKVDLACAGRSSQFISLKNLLQVQKFTFSLCFGRKLEIKFWIFDNTCWKQFWGCLTSLNRISSSTRWR